MATNNSTFSFTVGQEYFTIRQMGIRAEKNGTGYVLSENDRSLGVVTTETPLTYAEKLGGAPMFLLPADHELSLKEGSPALVRSHRNHFDTTTGYNLAKEVRSAVPAPVVVPGVGRAAAIARAKARVKAAYAEIEAAERALMVIDPPPPAATEQKGEEQPAAEQGEAAQG